MPSRTNLDICAEQNYLPLRGIVRAQNTFVPDIPPLHITLLSRYDERAVTSAGGSLERYARTSTAPRVALEVAGLARLIAQELALNVPAGLVDDERLGADIGPAGMLDNEDSGYAIATALGFLYVNKQLGGLVDNVRHDIDPLNKWPHLISLAAASSFVLIEAANWP